MGRFAVGVAVVAVALMPSSAVFAEQPAAAPGFQAESGRSPGAVPGPVQEGAWVVGEHIQARPDQYTGSAVTPAGIVVTLPPGGDLQDRMDAVDALVDAPVRFQVVPRSLAQLDALQGELGATVQTGRFGDRVTGIGTDVLVGAVVVYLDARLSDAETEDVRVVVGERHGDAVVFRKMGPAEFTG